MIRNLLPALLITITAAAAAPPAHAAPTAPSRADKAEAKARIKSGDVNYRLFKFDQALTDYQQAYHLSQHPAIAFNIAQAYRQLKNYEKASFYYKLFLADWAKRFPDKPPPYEAEVKGHIERLTKLIAAAAARAPKDKPKPRPKKVQLARLELEGLRAGAQITVDGKLSKSGPELLLAPGPRRLRVELDGYHPWEQTITLRAGKPVTRPVELEVIDRRTLWLSTSAGLSAVAAGFLGMGIYFNARHDNFMLGTPEADDNKRLSVIGYAVAGGVAALALASWTLYWLHRRSVKRLTSF